MLTREKIRVISRFPEKSMLGAKSALSGFGDEMVTIGSDSEKVQAEQVRPKRVKDGGACIYFGRERLARAKARANRSAGGNLSKWICNLVDSGLDLSPETLKKVNALAELRGISPGKLIERLIEDSVRV